MIPFLISTPLEKNDITDAEPEHSFVFLGRWCVSFKDEKKYQKKDLKILSYHWDDREKLKCDHEYIRSLYEKTLEELSLMLNKYHSLNETKEYWRIIIGPWLLAYIPILFDRWEMLRIAFQNNSNYRVFKNNLNQDQFIPFDFNDFTIKFQSDLWNYNIYQRIINFKYLSRVTFENLNLEKGECPVYKPKSNRFKKIADSVDSMILKPLSKNTNRYFFYDTYFPPDKLLKLFLGNKMVPRIYSNEFNLEIRYEIDHQKRDLEIPSNNQFEEFLGKYVWKDIPAYYLEAFSGIKKQLFSLKYNPEIIVTANGYWNNDIFKIWVAQMKNLGKKFLICVHGGSFPVLYDTFQHEEAVSDYFLTWFKPFHHKHVQLPPSKIRSISEIKKGREFCGVIGFEAPKYSYRLTAAAYTNQVLECFEHTCQFCNLLNDKIQAHLKIRPYANIGWETRKRYEDKFGVDKVDQFTHFKKFLRNSKLVVCTYPETTFTEAMASGSPTILLYISKYFELIPEADALLKTLRDNKILFTDPVEAANHINAIWDTIDEWWMSEEIAKVKLLFFETAAQIKDNWRVEWMDFLESI